jgi:hypothetical protein
MNTTTKAAFRTVAEADVFAADKAPAKVVRPYYLADMDHAASMARGWAVLADCGRPGAAERFNECIHTAMGWRPEHTADELTF